MILECKDWRQALRFCEIRDDCSDSDDPNDSIGYEQCSILQMCLDPDVSGNAACKETTPFRELIKEMPGFRLFAYYKLELVEHIPRVPRCIAEIRLIEHAQDSLVQTCAVVSILR
jgi:hypothetical protein